MSSKSNTRIKCELKSFDSNDPLLKYTVDHSIRLTKAQQDLIEVSLKHPKGTSLGAPEVLQLNQNLIRCLNAKKVLDIGVFTGSSSLAAALALPSDGEVHALDICDEYMKLGRPFWKVDGVEDKIKVHINPASKTLDSFIADGQTGTFDFAFIDADKVNSDVYIDKCHILVRSGGVIAIDNTLWNGNVIKEEDQTEQTVAIRTTNSKLKNDDRFHISFLNVGDGLTLLFKK